MSRELQLAYGLDAMTTRSRALASQLAREQSLLASAQAQVHSDKETIRFLHQRLELLERSNSRMREQQRRESPGGSSGGRGAAAELDALEERELAELEGL